jgi:transposase
MNSGIRVMQQMAKTLMFHAFGLLAWYDYPISTGPLEGPTTRSRPCNAKPTASVTRSSSN